VPRKERKKEENNNNNKKLSKNNKSSNIVDNDHDGHIYVIQDKDLTLIVLVKKWQ
jgi:hypothetical protein